MFAMLFFHDVATTSLCERDIKLSRSSVVKVNGRFAVLPKKGIIVLCVPYSYSIMQCHTLQLVHTCLLRDLADLTTLEVKVTRKVNDLSSGDVNRKNLSADLKQWVLCYHGNVTNESTGPTVILWNEQNEK